MATQTSQHGKRKKEARRFVGKPSGQVNDRVQQCGPDHFGIVAVDCAKRRSKWMLCNFYGKVLVEPTVVEHTAAHLSGMVDAIRAATRQHHLADQIVAVEMTGIYHRPVVAACRAAGLETRTVHPFASSHYRRVAHPDLKTDDHDLEAIFLAATHGFGLVLHPLDETHLLVTY
jgi:Transposase